MDIENHEDIPPPARDWIKAPETCAVLKCRSARLYEIIRNLDTEDPQGIIKTFVLKSPQSSKGTRLFDKASLIRYLEWKYEAAKSEGAYAAR